MRDTEFNVHRRTQGEWRGRQFKMPLQFASQAARNTIRLAFEYLSNGDQEDFNRVAISDWLRDLHIVWPCDNRATVELQCRLVDRLLAIADETADSALVYVDKDDALQFIGSPVTEIGKGGRPAHDSDEFWIQVLRIMVKSKPKLTREQIKNEVLPVLLESRSEGWIKKKLKMAFETLGWLDELSTIEPARGFGRD
jgi:hypothetical protein